MSKLIFSLLLAGLMTGLKADSVSSRDLPTEVGMYQHGQSGAWEEIEAVIFNTKTGGVVKSFATLGMIKPDVNANIWRRASVHIASYRDEFLVIVPEHVSIGEYQMIRLHEQKKSREFRMRTGGIFHYSSGSQRDNEVFDSKKIAPNAYLISFPVYDGDGAFGLLPPPSFNPTPYAYGRIYCFQMHN